jgi:hypothetical protein
MTRRKRGEATKAILQRLKKGPAFPKKLSEELNLPESTVKYNLRNILLSQGSIKQLDDGKYALESWNPDDLKIKNSHEHLSKLLFRQPTPEEIAALIQETPSRSRDMLFRYIPGYYEPTEDEKETSLKRIWYTICLGLDIKFPTDDEKIANKQLKMTIRGLNHYNSIEMQKWMKQDNIIFSQEKSRDYLREFPEMNPKIQRYFKKNDLYIIIEWSDYAIHLLHSMPEFDGFLTIRFENDEIIGTPSKMR